MFRSSSAVPFLPDNRVMHLGLAEGEVAPRILTVGHPARAEYFSQFLDPDSIRVHRTSSRGFQTYTGRFEGVEISIISIGMGLAMMDFFVREVRSVVPRGTDIAIIRVGTCGGLQRDVKVGTIAVAKEGGILVRRNCDSFLTATEASGTSSFYSLTQPCRPDENLTKVLLHHLEENKDCHFITGLNVSAESFYSTQARRDPNFLDHNEDLLQHIMSHQPNAIAMEMETFQLLHLAECSRSIDQGGAGKIHATAAAVVLVNRHTNEVVDEEISRLAERNAGLAAMKALIHYENSSSCIETRPTL